MIRTYALLVVGLALIAAGAATYSTGAALAVVGAGCLFIWWDSGEADQ